MLLKEKHLSTIGRDDFFQFRERSFFSEFQFLLYRLNSFYHWSVSKQMIPYSLISIPYPRLNSLKTLPFTAAHTHIAYIWEYPPPPPPGYHAMLNVGIGHSTNVVERKYWNRIYSVQQVATCWQQQQFIQYEQRLQLCYPQLAGLFSVGNNTIIIQSSNGKKRKWIKKEEKRMNDVNQSFQLNVFFYSFNKLQHRSTSCTNEQAKLPCRSRDTVQHRLTFVV